MQLYQLKDRGIFWGLMMANQNHLTIQIYQAYGVLLSALNF